VCGQMAVLDRVYSATVASDTECTMVTRLEQRAPLRLKIAGAFFALIGAATLAGVVVETQIEPRLDLLWSLSFALLFLAGGVGLLTSRRWGWVGSATAAGSLTAVGLWLILPTVGDPWSAEVGWLLLCGAVILLAILASPKSVRWLRS